MKQYIPFAEMVSGMILMAIGAWLIAPAYGCIVLGVCLFVDAVLDK